MALKVHDSLKVAQKIVDMLMNDHRLDSLEGFVEAYQNGREQGYSIMLYTDMPPYKQIFFAEDRTTDSIVVYFGNASEQSIGDDAYAAAKYFKPNNYEGAVDYIVDLIKAHQREED